MRWAKWLVVTVCVFGLVHDNGWARRPKLAELSAGLVIHIHNFTAMDEVSLSAAARDAEAIFQQAGVAVRVNVEPMAMRDGERKPLHPFAPKPVDLVVNILTREMAGALHVDKYVLGVAPGAGLANRNVVYVFAHRVKELSQMTVNTVRGGGPAWVVSESRVMAYALAHEIGHLLLNSEGHPRKGIMRGNWRYSELLAMAAMSLRFLPAEVEKIKLSANMRLALAGEVATSESINPGWSSGSRP